MGRLRPRGSRGDLNGPPRIETDDLSNHPVRSALRLAGVRAFD